MIILLGSVHNGKALIVCRVSKEISHLIPANKVIKIACYFIGGNGGGNAEFAQGGGKDIDNLNVALDVTKYKVIEIIRRLSIESQNQAG